MDEQLELTAIRIHELAIQRWLYDNFHVKEGYPVPVVFSGQMDAFANFKNLWKQDSNPFRYLLEIKDADGKPLYEPYPSVPRYPLISVHRRNSSYRTQQNYSIHYDRKYDWPTISGAEDGLTAPDLGRVRTVRYPQAWNFNYQIDHMCMRPDTQAFFMQRMMKLFWRGGGSPQAWIQANYPGWGEQYIRVVMTGDIENLTPPEPADGGNVEYRTGIQISVEGYVHDAYPVTWPTFWTLVVGTTPLNLDQLYVVTAPTQTNTIDEKEGDTSFVFQGRDNPPPQPVT